MQELPVLTAPRNRGRFSDRTQWEAIHWDRLARYQAGHTIVDIAAAHGVKRRNVYYSIERCLSRMPAREADAVRIERWKRSRGTEGLEWILREIDRLGREQARLSRKYAMAMDRLLASEKTRDLDRGMTHFERSVGIAAGAANVLVDNRQQTATIVNPGGAPRSFEEVMDKVRARLLAERRQTTIASGSSTDNDDRDA
jgi:hypothetical protein